MLITLGPDGGRRHCFGGKVRTETRYQGDLAEYITEVLISVDLSTVVLVVQKV